MFEQLVKNNSTCFKKKYWDYIYSYNIFFSNIKNLFFHTTKKRMEDEDVNTGESKVTISYHPCKLVGDQIVHDTVTKR